MGAGLFWGLVLMVIGLSIIFKGVFDISIMRIVIAVLFILIGVKILIGKKAVNISSDENDIVFGERSVTEFPLTNREYNTVFGKTVFDFRDASIPTDKQLDLEFNTVFGHTEILLPAGLAVHIKADAVFGAAKLPNDNTAVFGSANYVSDHDTNASTFVNIKSSTVFGNTEIFQRRPKY